MVGHEWPTYVTDSWPTMGQAGRHAVAPAVDEVVYRGHTVQALARGPLL